MSILYLGTSTEALASQLSANIVDEMSDSGTSALDPPHIVIPNRNLRRWLQIRLARTLGVAMNIDFQYFEKSVLATLDRLHPDGDETGILEELEVRMMILAALFGNENADDDGLAPLRTYVGAREAREREYSRRAWQLSGKLASLFRDYEYHRAEMTRQWLSSKRRGGDEIERAQRVMYQLVFGRRGVRDVLSKARGKQLETLSQYVARATSRVAASEPPRDPMRIHIFGLSSISPFHTIALGRLARHVDARIYVPTPLASAIASNGSAGAGAVAKLRELVASEVPPVVDDSSIGWAWASAGRESLYLLSALVDDSAGASPGFELETVLDPDESSKGTGTVLGTLHADVRSSFRGEGARPSASVGMDQDASVQVLACPGIRREVETVRDSILANIADDPSLTLADMAVFVTDMATYRPLIQAVFTGGAEPLPYNLTDFKASDSSFYGAGLLQLIDVAMGRFSRSEVFSLLSNPCFMEAIGASPGAVQTWLRWADELGIHHSFDRSHKKGRGYHESDLYTWHQGLRRLRLGQVLSSQGAGAFADIVPFSDIDSSDRGVVGDLSVAVELLFASARDLAARPQRAGSEWARELSALANRFLDVPDDRPEEKRVRQSAREAFSGLARFDEVLSARGGNAALPLPLVREYVAEELAALDASVGSYLTGGVTVSELQPMRPIPFKVAYVVGLNESRFPRRARPDAMDLRGREPRRGDVGPSDADEYLMLEAVGATSKKLYLSYVARDLEKDERLHPSRAIARLERHLSSRILNAPFERLEIPLHGTSVRYLEDRLGPKGGDGLRSFSRTDRLLCLADPMNAGEFELSPDAARRLAEELSKARAVVPAPQAQDLSAIERLRLTIGEIAQFIRNPLEAGMRRHLRLSSDDEEIDMARDDEPFFSDSLSKFGFVTGLINDTALRVVQTDSGKLPEFSSVFDAAYRKRQLQGKSPEGAFAEVDAGILKEDATWAWNAVAAALAELRSGKFLGCVAVGEAAEEVVSLLHLPPFSMHVHVSGEPRVVEVHGASPLAWITERGLEVLVITGGKVERAAKHTLRPFILSRVLAALGEDAGPLAGRPLVARVLARDGKGPEWCAAECVWDPLSKEEATEYLESLAAPFLDAKRFDLLPFDIMANGYIIGKEASGLLLPVRAGEEIEGDEDGDEPQVIADEPPGQYAKDLRFAIEEDADARMPAWRRMDVLSLVEDVESRVPVDAFGKVASRLKPWFAGMQAGASEGGGIDG